MSERKAAIINVSKGLLNVSLVTLAAIGSTTGIPLLAGVTAIPPAVAASGILGSLMSKKQEEFLTLPIPTKWWTQGSQSWQTVCSGIEVHLADIINAVEAQLRKETSYPSSARIKQIFVEEVAKRLSPWEVLVQDRALVAGYVTPPLMEKSAVALKSAIDASRQDALALWLSAIADSLNRIQQATTTGQVIITAVPAVPAVPASTAIVPNAKMPDPQAIALILEQKRLQDAYDVYICYGEADEVEVMKIADQLKGSGILPWLDLLEVKPGSPEKRQQEQQIRKIPSAAVCVGQQKIIDQQELQMYSFLDEFLNRDIPLIPIILASAAKNLTLPPYLGTFGRVDFRRPLPEPMGQLLWGITGTRP